MRTHSYLAKLAATDDNSITWAEYWKGAKAMGKDKWQDVKDFAIGEPPQQVGQPSVEKGTGLDMLADAGDAFRNFKQEAGEEISDAAGSVKDAAGNAYQNAKESDMTPLFGENWTRGVGIFAQTPESAARNKNEQEQQMLKQMAAVGGVAVALPFLVRALRSGKTQEEQKKRTELFQAAETNPAINLEEPDLGTKYPEEEEENEKTASELNKTGGVWDEVKSWPGEVYEAPFTGAKTILGLGDKDKDWVYPSIAVLTLAGAGGLGWAWADKAGDKRRKKTLQKKLQQARENLNEEQFKMLAAQRNISEQEVDQALQQSDKQQSEEVEKSAGDDDFSWTTAAKQLIPLYILAAGYSGWKGGQYLARKTDPRTTAYKEYKKSLKNQISEDDEPSEIYMHPDSNIKKLFAKTSEKEQKKRREETPTGPLTV